MIEALAFLANPAFWSGAASAATVGSSIMSATKGGSVGSLSMPSISSTTAAPKTDFWSGLLNTVTSIVPGLSGIMGGSSAKKAANFERDKGANTEHLWTGFVGRRNLYDNYFPETKGYLTEDDWNNITNLINTNLVPQIQQNPYVFDYEQKGFRSKYADKDYGTSWGYDVEEEKLIDSYVDAKKAAEAQQQQSQDALTALFNQLTTPPPAPAQSQSFSEDTRPQIVPTITQPDYSKWIILAVVIVAVFGLITYFKRRK